MIRIVIANEHPVVRQGLRVFLDSDPEFDIVGETDNGPEVLRLVEDLRPDVLIVDLVIRGQDGPELTQQITRQWPDVRVVILSIRSDETSVQKALGSGAVGYVLKDSTAAELRRAIHDVMAGRRYLSPQLSERAIEAFVRNAQHAPFDEYNTLTSREQEVFRLAALGLNNAEVAAKLSISPRTVETHRSRIMHKLGLRTQTELVRYALRRGIVPKDD
jgi:two-component system, NarL family, response regulator NreC